MRDKFVTQRLIIHRAAIGRAAIIVALTSLVLILHLGFLLHTFPVTAHVPEPLPRNFYEKARKDSTDFFWKFAPYEAILIGVGVYALICTVTPPTERSFTHQGYIALAAGLLNISSLLLPFILLLLSLLCGWLVTIPALIEGVRKPRAYFNLLVIPYHFLWFVLIVEYLRTYIDVYRID